MELKDLSTAFLTLLVVVNPIALAPVFISLAPDADRTERHKIALSASAIAGGILIFFALVGKGLLDAIGISIPAFRIAGGLLLFIVACSMLFDLSSQRNSNDAHNAKHKDGIENIAAFPLAIPLIAGPGAITAAILLGSQIHGGAIGHLGLIGVIIVIAAICYGVLLSAGPLAKVLGHTGNVVLTRLLGVMLAAMAVQFVITGVLSVKGG